MNDVPRRVLIVTSAFPPTMLADMHRARILSYELPKSGWQVEILVPSARFQRAVWIEPDSTALMPENVPVHEAQPYCSRLFQWLGMRSVGWRAFWPMYQLGCRLLGERRFDVVYITTAQFSLFCLGTLWARKFKTPYLLDYHDPWVRDRLSYTTTKHWLKLRIGAAVSRWMEGCAIRKAAGLVSVSPVYIDELRQRYGPVTCLAAEHCEVIPFAGSENDFRALSPPPDSVDGAQREIIYVGAGGPIMAKSFTAICAALAASRQNDASSLPLPKLRLFGTSSDWKPGDPRILQEIAASFGLTDVVEESPSRISYLRALELAHHSDGLLVLGVDDAGYMPSKLFTYALSGKPLLACLQSDSPSVKFFKEMPGLGNLMTFTSPDNLQADHAAPAMAEFLAEVRRRDKFNRESLIRDYLAPAMAHRHAQLFAKCSSRDCT